MTTHMQPPAQLSTKEPNQLGWFGEVARQDHTAWVLTVSRFAVLAALVPAVLLGLYTGRDAGPVALSVTAWFGFHAISARTPLRQTTRRGLRAGLLVDLLALAVLLYLTGGMISPLLAFAWIWAIAAILVFDAVAGWLYVVALTSAGVITSPPLGILHAAFDPEDPGAVISGATSLMTAAALAGYVFRRLRSRRAALVDEAMRDALTGLFNRRAFDLRIAEMCGSGVRQRPAFCVAVVDLDHFKVLNDQFGHEEGDRVLRQFARLMTSQVRPSDAVYRIGGEEFAVVFPETSRQDAEHVMNRARSALRVDTDGAVTFSAGVASGSDAGIVHRADQAMYAAKHAGRDTVRCSDVEGVDS